MLTTREAERSRPPMGWFLPGASKARAAFTAPRRPKFVQESLLSLPRRKTRNTLRPRGRRRGHGWIEQTIKEVSAAP